jgi:hypothetical protein
MQNSASLLHENKSLSVRYMERWNRLEGEGKSNINVEVIKKIFTGDKFCVASQHCDLYLTEQCSCAVWSPPSQTVSIPGSPPPFTVDSSNTQGENSGRKPNF